MSEKRGVFSLTDYNDRSIENKTDTLNDVWLFSQNNKIPYRYGETAPNDIVISDPGLLPYPTNSNGNNEFNHIGVGTDIIIIGTPLADYERLSGGSISTITDVGAIYGYDLDGKNIAYIPSDNNPNSIFPNTRYGTSVSIGSTFIFVSDNAQYNTAGVSVVERNTWNEYKFIVGNSGNNFYDSKKYGYAVAYNDVDDVVVVSDPGWLNQLSDQVGRLYIYNNVLRSSSNSLPRLEDTNETIINGGGSIRALGWQVYASGGVILATALDSNTLTYNREFYFFNYAGVQLTSNLSSVSNAGQSDGFGHNIIFRDGIFITSEYLYDGDIDRGLYYTGRVLVYSWTATSTTISFTFERVITASDGKALDEFGSSIALTNNNKLIVGAPGCDNEIENRYESDEGYGEEIKPNLGKESGAIYIYNLDGTGEIKINNPTGQTEAYWGHAVAANDDVIVVGENPEYSADEEVQRLSSGEPYQKVNILDFNSILANESRQNPTWYGNLLSLRNIQNKLLSSDNEPDDYFGYSIAAGNNKLVVGAYGNDNRTNGFSPINGSGAAYIYDLDGSNEVKITATTIEADQRYGASVAIGNSKIVVGASLDDTQYGTNSGSVYVCDLDGSNQFQIVPPGTDTGYKSFGYAVAVGDNKIVIGQPGVSISGASAAGRVYVFTLDGSSYFARTVSTPIASDRFGSIVAVGNGKIVVGMEANSRAGNMIVIYDLDGSNAIEISKQLDSGFGRALAIGENKIVVGGQGVGTIDGVIYIYDLDGTGEKEVVSPDSNLHLGDGHFDRFGSSVAIGGGKIFVGAPNYEPRNQFSPRTTGKVYVFTLDGDYLYSFLPVRDQDSQGFGDRKFGQSLAVSDGTLYVGDHLEGAFGFYGDTFTGYGAVYSYNIDDLTTYHLQKNAVI